MPNLPWWAPLYSLPKLNAEFKGGRGSRRSGNRKHHSRHGFLMKLVFSLFLYLVSVNERSPVIQVPKQHRLSLGSDLRTFLINNNWLFHSEYKKRRQPDPQEELRIENPIAPSRPLEKETEQCQRRNSRRWCTTNFWKI